MKSATPAFRVRTGRDPGDRCPANGTRSTAVGLRCGPNRARSGPTESVAAPAARASRPRPAPRWPCECARSWFANPRIQPAIQQVRDEIAGQREYAVDQDHAHDHGIVAIDRALD